MTRRTLLHALAHGLLAWPLAYGAIVLVGFMHASGQYVAHWTDTYGGSFSAKGAEGARRLFALDTLVRAP